MDMIQEPEFVMRSVDDGAALRLVGSAPDWPEYFSATLERPGLNCRVRVYAYEPRGQRFSTIFREMAAVAWKGWEGEKAWESLEGEIRLSFRMDSTGHVNVRVQIRDVYHWQIDTLLTLESGALASLAGDAEAFQTALEASATKVEAYSPERRRQGPVPAEN
jgi:hypothetical protein